MNVMISQKKLQCWNLPMKNDRKAEVNKKSVNWQCDIKRGCNLEISYLLTVLLSIPFNKLPCAAAIWRAKPELLLAWLEKLLAPLLLALYSAACCLCNERSSGWSWLFLAKYCRIQFWISCSWSSRSFWLRCLNSSSKFL